MAYIGAAKSAAKAGEPARTKQYMAKVMTLTKDADTKRPEVMQLRALLSGKSKLASATTIR